MKKKAPTWFKAWRKSLKLTQKEAAHLLGLKSRMVQNYEGGSHEIPLYIRLAMASLSEGIVDFDEGKLKRPKKALPIYAADSLEKSKSSDKKKSKGSKSKNSSKSET